MIHLIILIIKKVKNMNIIFFEELNKSNALSRRIRYAKIEFDYKLEKEIKKECRFEDNWDLFCKRYSRKDLSLIRSIGPKTLNEFESFLNNHGFYLRIEDEPITKTSFLPFKNKLMKLMPKIVEVYLTF